MGNVLYCMGKKRNWDKVKREHRAFYQGTLPHWIDGWGPHGDGQQLHAPSLSLKHATSKTANIEGPPVGDDYLLKIQFEGEPIEIQLHKYRPRKKGEVPTFPFKVRYIYHCIPRAPKSIYAQILEPLENAAHIGPDKVYDEVLERVFEKCRIPPTRLLLDEIIVYIYELKKHTVT